MPVDRKTCQLVDGCIGVRAPGHPACLAHADPGPALIQQAARSGEFRGLTIDGTLLTAILDAGRTDGTKSTCAAARFTHATFTDAVDFHHVRFLGQASFAYAHFASDAAFDLAYFDDVTFRSASFAGAVRFSGAEFPHTPSFHDTRFGGTTELNDLRLAGGADFSRALFEDTTRVTTAACAGSISFKDARFRGLLDVSLHADATDTIVFDDVLCEGQVDAQLSAAAISFARSRLERGGRLIVGRGDVTLHGHFGRPMLVAAASISSAPRPPRLVSVRGSDLSATTLAGFDLSDVRFLGVYGLDGLRVDSTAFAAAPRRSFMATRRVAVADELDARRQARPAAPQLAATHAEVAAIYRELRAGQEARKDEPGSADFYYGEMEMRRLAARVLSAERLVLTAYWLVCGYGLRASRAVVSLVILLLGSTLALQTLLVDHPPRLLRTLLFTVRSTVSLVRQPHLAGLTLAGEYLQLALRFAGPVLLALTALAIRSRVRR